VHVTRYVVAVLPAGAGAAAYRGRPALRSAAALPRPAEWRMDQPGTVSRRGGALRLSRRHRPLGDSATARLAGGQSTPPGATGTGQRQHQRLLAARLQLSPTAAGR